MLCLKIGFYRMVFLGYMQNIQRAVDLIESRLDDELTVDSIARAAGLSRWHFQVVFRAVVGDTLKEYIRKRRLTLAAVAVGETNRRLLDIALAAGFESHEAFTRAFKAMFGKTPKACRAAGIKSVMLRHKPKITNTYLNHLYRGITMQPTIKNFEKMHVVGLGGRFISAISPEANNLSIIPKLWSNYAKRCGEIKSRLSLVNLGVTICLEEKDIKSHPDEMLYIACTHVRNPNEHPEGMTSATIPAGKYALFTHRGPVENIGQTINYLYASWLPKSDYTLRKAPHLEIYDERFKPKSPESEIDVCVPIK